MRSACRGFACEKGKGLGSWLQELGQRFIHISKIILCSLRCLLPWAAYVVDNGGACCLSLTHVQPLATGCRLKQEEAAAVAQVRKFQCPRQRLGVPWHTMLFLMCCMSSRTKAFMQAGPTAFSVPTNLNP